MIVAQPPEQHGAAADDDDDAAADPGKNRRQGHEERFNASQRAAIDACMRRRVTLIQGPPGTGKTSVAVEVITRWVARAAAAAGEHRQTTATPPEKKQQKKKARAGVPGSGKQQAGRADRKSVV